MAEVHPPAPASRPVALIVEDNRVNRLVAAQMLKRAEIDSVEADGGERALELLSETAYDLVLMDVQMPGMDGLETARAIRAGAAGTERRGVPIVAMTAFSSPEDERECLAAGMDAYVAKPLNLQRLVDTARQLLGLPLA